MKLLPCGAFTNYLVNIKVLVWPVFNNVNKPPTKIQTGEILRGLIDVKNSIHSHTEKETTCWTDLSKSTLSECPGHWLKA